MCGVTLAAGVASRHVLWPLAKVGGTIVSSDGADKIPLDPVGAGDIRVVSHDSMYFTQGLYVDGDKLIEGTGLYGKSTLVEMDMPTTTSALSAKRVRVVRETRLDRSLFGEGICPIDHGDKILQLTWKAKTFLIYDRKNFSVIDKGQYATTTGEGWGVTPWSDGKEVVVSDGSEVLHFWDTTALIKGEGVKETRRVQVRDPASDEAVKSINELETIGDKIYANLWYQDYIIEIEPETGNISSWLDFRELYPKKERVRHADCLNGIAYDEKRDQVILTGKLWPNYYFMSREKFLSHATSSPLPRRISRRLGP